MDDVTDGVWVLRGSERESFHRVDAAVTDASGALVARVGDPDRRTYFRSAAKPFQALPLVEEGILEELDLEDADLAVACASHSGEAGHLVRVRKILERLELTPGDLACGAHPPYRDEEAREILVRGETFSALHNNCSGKHAGMLALATSRGWPTLGYHEAGHPVQTRMLAEISRWTGVAESDIGVGVDGCGVATFAVPLSAMARAYAALGEAAQRGEEGPARVVGAMIRHPFLVGGTGRLDTEIMERTDGRVLVKGGAEGVLCAALPDEGLGVALKVADGAGRAAGPALLVLLRKLELLEEDDVAELSRSRLRVSNTRNEDVGRLEPRIEPRRP